MLLAVSALADQQLIYPPSGMPRVDAHTHMDAKTQYAKAVQDMDQWGGTISISLAGFFWVKDNQGSNASPASVRQMPANDLVYVKENLNDRILFAPGAFTIPRAGIWWGVDEIKTFGRPVKIDQDRTHRLVAVWIVRIHGNSPFGLGYRLTRTVEIEILFELF